MTNSTVPYSRMQERVFAFLTDPATHPLVDRIDTHAASVFLEGDRALKIKRAVRFPFLDYSTLEKRKAACDEEIKINHPFAPQIYRRVVPITQGNDGSLDIDGDGAPVEYAIEMARFDERQTVLFDAIEFDPIIASVDVLYDLAFPVMDFIRYHRQAAANALLNRYLAMTPVENLDALAALP